MLSRCKWMMNAEGTTVCKVMPVGFNDLWTLRTLRNVDRFAFRLGLKIAWICPTRFIFIVQNECTA